MRAVLALPCTSAVAMTISFTYTSPGANCRHIVRNGALVTPAIGANTTGAIGVNEPIFTRPGYGPPGLLGIRIKAEAEVGEGTDVE